jgi:hypothetical protein
MPISFKSKQLIKIDQYITKKAGRKPAFMYPQLFFNNQLNIIKNNMLLF